MFEFLDKSNKNEYFSFAVPPESEDFNFGQRVTETKTMGGSVFDDYGNDTISIQIKGTTVNEEMKLIYRGIDGKFIPKYLSGEKEIFELQKLINDWGKGDKIPGKRIYLYDLSKMSALQIFGGNGGTASRNYWRVVIKNLKINRSKDKPNTYNYSLDMIGMEDTERTLQSYFSSGMTETLDTCQKVLEAFQKAYKITEAVADAIDYTALALVKTKKAYNDIKNGDTLTVIDKVFDAPMRFLTGGSSANLFNASKSLISATKKINALVSGKEEGTLSTGTASRDDQFSVIFDSMGGSYVRPETVIYSRMATMPTSPSKDRYKFVGWYSDENYLDEFDFITEITGDMTLFAKWEQTTAIVTFNSGLGSAIMPETVEIGGNVSAPYPPTRNGYSFVCWCSDDEFNNEFNFSTIINEDITLYARWKVVYTVTFNSNAGSAVEKQVIDVGGKVIFPPIPSLGNNLFGIWCTDSLLTEEYDFNTIVTASFTLYAKWTQVSNDVVFNSNGGSVVEKQLIAIGGYATKPPNPTKEGFNFFRWCIDSGLTQEFVFGSTPVNYPIILYAAWDIIVSTIGFESNGGNSVSSQDVEYGGLVVFPITPIKPGALFARWCMDEELTTEYDFATPVINNFTLYADWY